MKTKCAGKSVTGRRKNNEDAFCLDPRLGLFVVADGMGGHSGGEVASATAIQAIREFFRANREDDSVTWPFGLRRELSLVQNMVRVAVRSANHAVMTQRKGELSNMGSTVVVLALRDDRAVVAHMGDSRVYRIRHGRIDQLTRDHSLYNELLDSGADDLGPENDFPYRNIVTRALGFTTSAGEEPDLGTEVPHPDDVYLLCTDGLYEALDDETIVGVVRGADDLDAACDRLVELAFERGSNDNITAVLVRVSPE